MRLSTLYGEDYKSSTSHVLFTSKPARMNPRQTKYLQNSASFFNSNLPLSSTLRKSTHRDPNEQNPDFSDFISINQQLLSQGDETEDIPTLREQH
jgi:hypothetical protein